MFPGTILYKEHISIIYIAKLDGINEWLMDI